MKYFKKKIPNIKEYREMRRVARHHLSKQGLSKKEIAEELGMAYKNVCLQAKKPIDEGIDEIYDRMISCELYPIKQKSKVVWRKI